MLRRAALGKLRTFSIHTHTLCTQPCRTRPGQRCACTRSRTRRDTVHTFFVLLSARLLHTRVLGIAAAARCRHCRLGRRVFSGIFCTKSHDILHQQYYGRIFRHIHSIIRSWSHTRPRTRLFPRTMGSLAAHGLSGAHHTQRFSWRLCKASM